MLSSLPLEKTLIETVGKKIITVSIVYTDGNWEKPCSIVSWFCHPASIQKSKRHSLREEKEGFRLRDYSVRLAGRQKYLYR